MSGRTPTEVNGCLGKTNLGRAYTKYADELAEKHGKKYGVYHCPHCHGHHLTTKLEKSDEYNVRLLHITATPSEKEKPRL